VGPYVAVNAVLIGLFGFAAIYHVVLWSQSRRDAILITFAVHCAMCALFSGTILALVTTQTVGQGQRALDLRADLGILVQVSTVWLLSLISGVRARWFVWLVTTLLLAAAIVKVAILPLAGRAGPAPRRDHRINTRGRPTSRRSAVMPKSQGVRTARKLLVGLGIGLAFISICSLFALIYLFKVNAVVRHLALDPVPGSAAIASVAKDFNQYRVLESSSRPFPPTPEASLTQKAADIERDLKAYDVTITQADDRRRFADLMALWSNYRDRPADHEQGAEAINALLTTLVDWNRLEGVRSIQTADSATRAVTATVILMLVAAMLLSALAFHFNRTVERPMNALAETARAVALGDRDVRAKIVGPYEVATVARELNEMLDARARADAETRTLHAALEASREQLQHLTAGLLHAREEERTKVSREIHDVLGQTLTALKMDTGWIGLRLPEDALTVRVKLAAMAQLIDETVVAVRRLATELRPGLLDDLGLVAAVEWQAQEFERRTGIHCVLGATAGDSPDPPVSTAIFRILQESLSNVAEHSRASRVMVTLEQCGTGLVLEVRDNGIGIAPADASNSRSIGLAGMRERAQLVGGDFSISGTTGAGTTVRVQIPRHATVSA